MKVKELIAILNHNPQLHELELRMSGDVEGNYFGSVEKESLHWEGDKLYLFPVREYLEFGE